MREIGIVVVILCARDREILAGSTRRVALPGYGAQTHNRECGVMSL